MKRRLRHLGLIARDIAGHSVVNRNYWMVPVVVLLGLAILIAVTGQAVAPVTIYPLL